jgi:phenylpyruvate tautomerase PptA (4-oxalocrotonate tautomerase family)
VERATQIVTEVSGDPSQASRTWVFLTEAAEGGWEIGGVEFEKAEFVALRGS